MAKPGTQADTAPEVSMLKLEGELKLNQEFFARIDKQIRESVSAAFDHSLKQLPKESTNSKSNMFPSNRSGGGLELLDGEQQKARTARHDTLGIKLKEDQGMIDGKTLAAFLDISYRGLYRLMAEGAIPEPVALNGRIKRWPVEEVMAWVLIGCPRAESWKRKRIQAIRDYRALATS